MAEDKVEIAVGAAVLALAVGFVVYTAQATGFGSAVSGGGNYALTASFRSAEGVSAGTDVRLSGVKIGTVSGVVLNPETLRADATVAIRQGVEIPDDSVAAISSEGLLGGNFVEVLPGGSPFPLEADMAFPETQGALDLLTLLSRFVGGGE